MVNLIEVGLILSLQTLLGFVKQVLKWCIRVRITVNRLADTTVIIKVLLSLHLMIFV